MTLEIRGYVAGFEDGEEDTQQVMQEMLLWVLEKARKQILPLSLQKE